MLKDIKSTIKNSIIYGVGNLSSRILSLILIPIYTKNIPVSVYGTLSVVDITWNVLIACFGLGLYMGFFRWYSDKEHVEKRKSMFFTVIATLAAVSCLMFLIMSSFSHTVAQLLCDNSNYGYLINIMAISAGFEIIFQMPNALIRLQERPMLYTVSNLMRLSVQLVLSVYFVVYAKRSLEGIYEAIVISQVVYFLSLSKYIWKNMEVKFDTIILKNLFIFSFPLAISAIAAVTLSNIDRYTLNFLNGKTEVGLYSLGFKMANTLYMLVGSINLALIPLIFKKMNDPNHKRFYSKIMTYYTFGLMFFVLGMSLFGKEILKVYVPNPNYWDACKIIPVISFGIIFTMLKDISLTGLQIVKKTKILASVIIATSIVNFGFDILLIPLFSNYGAAFAYLFSQVIYFSLIYYFSQKQYFIPYELLKIAKLIGLGAILFGIGFLTGNMNLAFRLLIKSVLIIIFPIILYFLNFYEDVEILAIKNGWDKWKDPKKWKGNLENIKL